MNETDYVVRRWQLTNAGHARVTVVDMRGRVAHVTVRDTHLPHANVDAQIRARLNALPLWTGYRQ